MPLVLACAAETVELPPPPPVHWQKPPAPTASPVVPTSRERAVAQAYARALTSPGLTDLPAVLDDHALLVFGGNTTRGRERVVKRHREIFDAFAGRRFTVSRVWLTDSTQTLNSQTVEWTMTGLQTGEWSKVPPTGKPVAIKGLTLLWTTDDGIITELHVYFDEDLVRAQLGAGPAELRKLRLPGAGSETTTVKERQGSPEEAANVATMRAMLKALEENQEAVFVSKASEDLRIVTLDDSEPSRGKEAVRTYFRNIRRAIRQVDTVVQNVWGVGSFAIIEFSLSGLQIASLNRVAFAESGGPRPLHTQSVDVAEFRDGKLACIWRYSDPAAFPSL